MRIKIETRKTGTEVILDVMRVEKYEQTAGGSCLFIKENNMLFDVGEEFENIFNSLLKDGYADLSGYNYRILDGMCSNPAKL